jgi:cobalt/nickel transport system permease protein
LVKIKKKVCFAGLLLLLALWPSQAFAMHIMEGFLPLKWALFWTAAALPFIIAGFRAVARLFAVNPEYKMLLALTGAFVFVLSALKMPSVTGSCSHPTGIGLGAILFGPVVMSVVSTVVLLFQALLLAHGGLSTLGANVFSMGVAGPLVAFTVYLLAKKVSLSRSISVFLASTLAVLATYLVTSLQMALAFPMEVGGVAASFAKFAAIFALTQLPLALSEGILTVIIFNVLYSYNREEILGLLTRRKDVGQN